MTSTEQAAWIRLSLEPGLSPALARQLLDAVGLPQKIYALSGASLQKYLDSPLSQQMCQAPSDALAHAIHTTQQWLQQENHHLLTPADTNAGYPKRLLTPDYPIVLYAKGRLELLNRPALAIVGARAASRSGCRNAHDFAQQLASEGWTIVSGLALGIDGAAHQGALQAGPSGGSTIAILGTGIDRVYPAQHQQLAHQISSDGLLLSEFPLGARARPFHFPKRNRLVAMLSHGVLVVEAARKSGSLITAQVAAESGREVFAIPGSIHSPLSRGCHQLIRQGAKLVESVHDIYEELNQSSLPGITRQQTPPKPRQFRPARFSAEARIVLDTLGGDPMSTEGLLQYTTFDVPTLSQALLELELLDYIERRPDGRYQKI